MKRRSFFGTILGAVTAAKAAPKLKLTASDLALNLNRTNLSMVGHGLMERPEDDMRLVYTTCDAKMICGCTRTAVRTSASSTSGRRTPTDG